ncbi:hypothetical protein JCM3774_003661 [Rhodotorula dairenensis]
MPRPTSTHVLAAQLEQAMTFYAARTPASSPPQPLSVAHSSAASSTQTLSTTSSASPQQNGTRQAKDDDGALHPDSIVMQKPTLRPLQPAPPTTTTTRYGDREKEDSDEVLTDEDLEAELADFGYGSRRRRPIAKKESLLDILNSEPPPWLLDDEPSSRPVGGASTFSLEPTPSTESSTRSRLVGKIRRRLRASTLVPSTATPASRHSRTPPLHASLPTSGPTASGVGDSRASRGGRGGGEGLTTLRNSKSSGNLLAHLTRKARGSLPTGGRSVADLSLSTALESRWTGPPLLPQMLPFDLPPLTTPTPPAPPVNAVRPADGTNESKLQSPSLPATSKQKFVSKPAAPRSDESSTRDLVDFLRGGPEDDDNDDLVTRRRLTTKKEVTPAAAGRITEPDWDSFEEEESGLEKAAGGSPRPASTGMHDPEPTSDGSVSEPLRTDSDESVISYASIQKSPTRGPLPQRISRKAVPASTTIASGTLIAPTADQESHRHANREAIEFTASPTEDADLSAPRFSSWPPFPQPPAVPGRAAQPSHVQPLYGDDSEAGRVDMHLRLLQDRISAFLLMAPGSRRLASPDERREVAALASRLTSLLDPYGG